MILNISKEKKTFENIEKKKNRENAGEQHFSPFLTMFSIIPIDKFPFRVKTILL